MRNLASLRENPDQFANRLSDFLLNRREQRIVTWSGDATQISDMTNHIDYLEPIPSKKFLRLLIETAFYASIAREEGVDVTFSLTWTDPKMAAENEWPRLQFDQRLPFDVEGIRKLSPASDPDLVDIAIFDGKDGVEIWGLLFVRDKSTGRRSYPHGLVVVVDGPGVLSVKVGSELVGTYSRGLGVILSEGIQIDSITLVQILAKIFSDHREGIEKFLLATKILDFANEALLAGQGATVLVTMGQGAPKGISFPKYSIEKSSREQLSDLLSHDDFIYLTKSISRIALVDGAVVLNEYGVVYGFGGMINMDGNDDFDIVLWDTRNFTGDGKHIKLSEFSGGARHRSALSYCYANPGAAGLVVSHDGIMSVFTRPLQEDCVYVIRPLYKSFDLGM